MSRSMSVLLLLSLLSVGSIALRYDPTQSSWNLNENQYANTPLEYWGEWEGHNYTHSPESWRFPIYTVALDRYSNGDPTNDDANGTAFEHDWMSNQFRYGGDVLGLLSDLDYIQGMGVKAIYIMGSPFINQPWMADGYSPLDLTLLDHHHGTIEDWRKLIDAIHQHDMYVILDNTMGTLGDLLGFRGYLNATAPFNWLEYDYIWKSERRYHDFEPGNNVNETCRYPRFWDDYGYPLTSVHVNETQCRDSEFDSYGDLASVGHVVVYENQLGKFGSVQDRLREWHDDVGDKIKHFSCIQIAMLDIDGFRMDKAFQTTVDAMADFSTYQRECAKRYGKENFLVIGETVGTDGQGAIYYGRGKQGDQYYESFDEAITSSNASGSEYVRDFGMTALDGSAFQYTVYGGLERLLGIRWNGEIGEHGIDFVAYWNSFLLQNDLVNANTGKFDPRHFFGTTTQDVFRWPAITNGTERQLLGNFITALMMPGIPTLFWGEEQALYILDTTAENYVYGRQPMSSSRAWQIHGCHALSFLSFRQLHEGPARDGCHDDNVSLDHKDPSHPVRNILKRMYEIRRQYPALNDGWRLETLSSQIHENPIAESDETPSPTGIWSVSRSMANSTDDHGEQAVWLLYSNVPQTTDFSFDCSNRTSALLSPFRAGTIVKSLFWPYDEYVLENSTVPFTPDGLQGYAGCFSNFTINHYGWGVFVPKDRFTAPAPTITRVVPSHDSRLLASVDNGARQTVPIEIHFSVAMDCDIVARSITIKSKTEDGTVARVNRASVLCKTIDPGITSFSGQPATMWKFTAVLEDVAHGIHTITVQNPSTVDGLHTNAVDRFMFRIGQSDNPMVFPLTSNYTSNLLHRNDTTNEVHITPWAPGADLLRYSRTWGSSWSQWINYTGDSVHLEQQPWAGTEKQGWPGEHIMVQYWSKMAASSDHIQHADLDFSVARRWPHAFVLGEWNVWGYDDGLSNAMALTSNGVWTFDLAAEWPTKTTINIWGMNPDGSPDKTQRFGDIDQDGILDWLHPDTLQTNVLNLTSSPGMPYAGWKIVANDGNYTYYFVPVGSGWNHLIISILLGLAPLFSGLAAVWIFRRSFYQVKFNQVGISPKPGTLSGLSLAAKAGLSLVLSLFGGKPAKNEPQTTEILNNSAEDRRTVLIATMEYEIDDWNIKIKIGGLGVMASLMGKALGHQNLIWVVPCVGGVEYPVDTVAEPMLITINGMQYRVDVQYHILRNITFVLLDAPIFRQQTKAEPYPPRMDDLDSAIYYSAWNASIAEAIKRFPVDLYHINDYHGALAPLHLLPNTIPVSLSLHNAEFQGLWPLRSAKELHEISQVFNLPVKVIRRYVQFGEVFNLLHASATYLRVHQNGFGAVGVSKKYGTRALKRYSIFWGLSTIGSLPNPDPSDTADGKNEQPSPEDVVIDQESEAERGRLRVQAQEWAGLKIDPDAQLFVFVGRWSEQKGVDLIADVFPALLEKHPHVQLICVGPVVDLHGKFAALKLEKIMERYPRRVLSKPEFTVLPPFIFSGAEFALIPSRDEPFGLVAVEFGRKGALGVGSRVGGLGQMPGWWYTIESNTTKHLHQQFKSAIRAALASTPKTRAIMRARSSLQRFPVAQWIRDLEILQASSIETHRKSDRRSVMLLPNPSTDTNTACMSPTLAMSFRSSYVLGTTAAPSEPGTTSGTASPAVSSSRDASRAPSLVRREGDGSTSGVEPGSGASTPATGRPGLMQSFSTLLTPRLRALADRNISGLTFDQDCQSQRHASGSMPAPTPPSPRTPTSDTFPEGSAPAGGAQTELPFATEVNQSVLTVNTIVGDRKDFELQNVDPFFTDPGDRYYTAFSQRLDAHKDDLSSSQVCVEQYLRQSERDWFSRLHEVKLGKPDKRGRSQADGPTVTVAPAPDDEFQLGEQYAPPRGLRRILQIKLGDWPLYTFLLALGQIIAANSYQITLLTGQNGEGANRLYVLSSIILVASVFWWILFRYLRSVYTLSLPFLFYGAAFLLLGLSPYATTTTSVTWLQNVATGLYAVGSASGFLFFTLNFGSEGGTPVRSWVFRACAIQGTQQIYLAALWYWGSYVSSRANNHLTTPLTTNSVISAITMPVAVLMWVVGAFLFLGLPEYYRTKPGTVPAWHVSLLRRRVVVWFFIVVIIQNYWLSAPYGRSWTYLWSSNIAPVWAVAALTLFFFVVVWALILYIFARLSREHTWALPMFAIGLGAPRWCQMLWGTSGIGLYLPWVPGSSAVAGALLGRALWLWLGVLDTLQGVGLGMVLLQTLTRFHMSCAIAGAQILGSLLTIAARATAPNNIGPGPVFPNLALDLWSGISDVYFWVALALQLIVGVGFFLFFRKEQLCKP